MTAIVKMTMVIGLVLSGFSSASGVSLQRLYNAEPLGLLLNSYTQLGLNWETKEQFFYELLPDIDK